MIQNEISHQFMHNFLRGYKFWLYVTGDLKKPTQEKIELDEALHTRLIDWDNNQHQINT